MGRDHGSVSNSIIINSSTVQNSFNREKSFSDFKNSKEFKEIVTIVQQTGNEKASELVDEIGAQLKNNKGNKVVLKSLWESLIKIVPLITESSKIISAVSNLFKE